MDVNTTLAAVPWARRVWKLLPTPLRVPLLVIVAVIGIWYAVSGRRQLAQQQAGPQAQPEAADPAAADRTPTP